MNMPEKMHSADKPRRLNQYLLSLSSEQFTGYIKIGFFQGDVESVERFSKK
jgi:hypothetical protein